MSRRDTVVGAEAGVKWRILHHSSGTESDSERGCRGRREPGRGGRPRAQSGRPGAIARPGGVTRRLSTVTCRSGHCGSWLSACLVLYSSVCGFYFAVRKSFVVLRKLVGARAARWPTALAEPSVTGNGSSWGYCKSSGVPASL